MHSRIDSSKALLLRSLAAILSLGLALTASARDGVLEIDEACVSTGCFPGDAPGFPVTISDPGSYRLTSALDVTAEDPGTPAIDVRNNYVTIDLAGFQIEGRSSCTGTPPGPLVCSPSGARVAIEARFFAGIEVRGGGVHGLAEDGVVLGAAGVVRDLTATNNAGSGIVVGPGSLVFGNVPSRNGENGLVLARGSAALENRSAENGLFGLLLPADEQGCIVARNTLTLNGVDGLKALAGAGGCVIAENAFHGNGVDGLTDPDSSVVVRNTAISNGGNGYEVALGSVFRENVASRNDDFGISLDRDGAYSHNVSIGNTDGPITSGANRFGNYCEGPNTNSEFCP